MYKHCTLLSIDRMTMTIIIHGEVSDDRSLDDNNNRKSVVEDSKETLLIDAKVQLWCLEK